MPPLRTARSSTATSWDLPFSTSSATPSEEDPQELERPTRQRKSLPVHGLSPSPYIRQKKQKSSLAFNVQGVELNPTVVFDTFWYFAAERKAIEDKRRAGLPAPWTDDPILQENFFCNSFRVLDKTSQYLIKEVIEKGSQDHIEVTFRVLLFSLFNRIEAWDILSNALGNIEWTTYDGDRYENILMKAVKSGISIYTAAYQKHAKNSLKFDGGDLVNHLRLLEILMDDGCPDKLVNALHLEDVYEYLSEFPSMGPFITFQLMLNLSYSNVLNFHRNDFVVAGVGSSSGLKKMFGAKAMNDGMKRVVNFESEVMRWLALTQEEHFERLGIEPPTVGPDRLPMDVADIEHTVCEVDKYSRIAHPQIKGGKDRKQIKSRKFANELFVIPRPAYFPKAWENPARLIPRIRPERNLVVKKRYVIDHIKDHYQDSDGRLYLVCWFGYPGQDTWESEEKLLKQAERTVQEYLTKRKKSKKRL